MNLLFITAFPFGNSGYSVQTRLMLEMFNNMFDQIFLVANDLLPKNRLKDRLFTLHDLNIKFNDDEYTLCEKTKFVMLNNMDEPPPKANSKIFIDYNINRRKSLIDKIALITNHNTVDRILLYGDLWTYGDLSFLNKFSSYVYLPVHNNYLEGKEVYTITNLKHFKKISTPSLYGVEVLNVHKFESVRIRHVVEYPIKPLKEKSVVRKRFNIPNKWFVVLMVGREEWNDRKAYKQQIEAFSIFAKKKEDCRLIIHEVHNHTLSDSHKELAKNLGVLEKIIFTDKTFTTQSQIFDLYRAADVLMCASKCEGFGLPMVEAQMHGLKVISNNCTSMPENTFYGVCVDPKRIDKKITDINPWSHPDPDAIAHVLDMFYTKNNTELQEIYPNLKPIDPKLYQIDTLFPQWKEFLDIDQKPTRLNLGCGDKLKKGFLNIDKYDTFNPDKVMDLEQFPWDIPSNSADYVLLNHVLEHLGKDTDTFLNIMKELYRICKPDAVIQINVPHPLSEDFRTDPTHVRRVTPAMLGMFSKANCRKWSEMNAANTPWATILDVDFRIQKMNYIFNRNTVKVLTELNILKTNESIQNLVMYGEIFNNLIKEINITLSVHKTLT